MRTYWLAFLFAAFVFHSGLAQAEDSMAPEVTECALGPSTNSDIQAIVTTCGRAAQITTDPQDLILVFNARGWAYLRLRDYPNAISDLSRAIQLNADDDDNGFAERLYNNRARAYDGIGDAANAAADRAKALSLVHPPTAGEDSDNCIMGSINLTPAQVVESCTRAIPAADNDEDRGTYYIARGDAYLDAHNANAALADFNAGIAVDPSYRFAFEERAKAYDALGDTAHAAADRAQASTLPED